jgi:hypothetical protein
MTPKFSFHSQTLLTPGVSCSRSAGSSVLPIDIAVICIKPDHGNRTAHPFRHKPFSELAPSQISNFKSQIPTASRRLWTAGRITALRAHGVRAARHPTSPPNQRSAPSDQARDREAPYSRHPTSNRPHPTSSPPNTPAPYKSISPQALQTSHFSLLTSLNP